MKYNIHIIFGKEQVDKFISNIPLSVIEQQINLKKYSFDSEIELNAFKRGVNESIGWTEMYLVENELILIE